MDELIQYFYNLFEKYILEITSEEIDLLLNNCLDEGLKMLKKCLIQRVNILDPEFSEDESMTM